MAQHRSQVLIKTLKEQWFRDAAAEDYPHTPGITADLDILTTEIQSMEMAGGQ